MTISKKLQKIATADRQALITGSEKIALKDLTSSQIKAICKKHEYVIVGRAVKAVLLRPFVIWNLDFRRRIGI